jgi:putative aminopeptidase FrvX
MKKASLDFFEELCCANGVAGFEREAVLVTKKYVEKYSDELGSDKIGSLHFTKKGSKSNPVILLPGHVDEIGFIVTGIHASGYVKFHPVGGWMPQSLLSQRVRIVTPKGPVSGVISSKPPHLSTAEERDKTPKISDMFIDICCSNEKEAQEMGVLVGQPIVPDAPFTVVEKTVFKKDKKAGKATLAMSKAFDDRVGVFIAAEVVRRLKEEKIQHPNTVVGAATTMEEVGLRGAMTTGYKVHPDLCITLDVDIAGDVPGIEKHQAANGLGNGVSICTYDGSLIPNQLLKEFVIETAKKEKIPYVLTCMAAGGTDGGVVHKTREGCPSIYLGIPTRHIHTHVGILDLADVDHTVDLLIALIKKMDAKTVESFTKI